MTLHELYDVLGDGLITLDQRVPNEGDYTIHSGPVADFPYHLMRDYGDCDVLTVAGCEIYSPGSATLQHGVRVVISWDEEDE